jgi:hypothetical protein
MHKLASRIAHVWQASPIFIPSLRASVLLTDELRVRSWVSQATLHRKLGQFEAAVKLLRKAARAEPKVEEAYLKPLLAELAAGQQMEGSPQQQQQEQAEQLPPQQEQQADGKANDQQGDAWRQGKK